MADVARTRQLPAVDDRARHARPVPRLTLLPRLATAGAALGLAAAITLEPRGGTVQPTVAPFVGLPAS